MNKIVCPYCRIEMGEIVKKSSGAIQKFSDTQWKPPAKKLTIKYKYFTCLKCGFASYTIDAQQKLKKHKLKIPKNIKVISNLK